MRLDLGVPSWCITPKSISFTAPDSVMRTLLALMSQCTYRREWMKASTCAIWMRMR